MTKLYIQFKKATPVFFLSVLYLLPAQAQETTEVDGIQFPVFTNGDSSSSNYIAPGTSVTHRYGSSFSTSTLHQPGNYRILSEKNDALIGKMQVDSAGVFLQVAGNDAFSPSSIQLRPGFTEINTSGTYFNGNWIKLPVFANYPYKFANPEPAGSLFYASLNRSLMLSRGDTIAPAYWEYPDGYELKPSICLTQWAQQTGFNNMPTVRVRHPFNTTGLNLGNASAERDFSITPYEYGMAIDYNGWVECWVGEWSIHKGFNYAKDPENNGNKGWGGILWVGDDLDVGGLRATSRNSDDAFYSELSSETFLGLSHGPLRLRTVDSTDQFQFVSGGRGSDRKMLSIERLVDTVMINAGARQTMSLTTNGESRLAIDSSGQIGIGTTLPTSLLDLNSTKGYEQLRLRKPFTPLNSSDPSGEVGQMSWDDNYIYIKTSNGWKRTVLEVF